ncbi:MAG: hypothetical protein K9J17_10995 [Flavobacteriales bacterium]|nr:hypothetical protein [Flavobacteriales bacterium]
MFKRLFLVSGIVAFVLAMLTMWFWYLPRQASIDSAAEQSVIPVDSLVNNSTETELPIE